MINGEYILVEAPEKYPGKNIEECMYMNTI